ncbi:prepilin peptidase [Sphingomicrobium sp. XHP0239]|uniref:prepilin peptidase n=1 Tax=Sphingomicrobium maritimum TaxID=3133972 RepID=UPI0031CCCC06
MEAVSPASWIVSGILLGAIVGSFLATLVVRWPEGKGALTGRSACDGCARTLSPIELVPIVSYVVLRGRCRACHAPIARSHVGIEIGAAAIGATAFAILPEAAGLALAAMGWLLLALGWLDARHLWLPDPLVLLLAGIGLAAAQWVTAITLTDRLIGGAAAFLLLEGLRRGYQRLRGHDGMGAGDPKLFGAIGLWTGWAMLPLVLLIGSAALLALALIRGSVHERTHEHPLGSALAAAAFLVACLLADGRI